MSRGESMSSSMRDMEAGAGEAAMAYGSCFWMKDRAAAAAITARGAEWTAGIAGARGDVEAIGAPLAGTEVLVPGGVLL